MGSEALWPKIPSYLAHNATGKPPGTSRKEYQIARKSSQAPSELRPSPPLDSQPFRVHVWAPAGAQLIAYSALSESEIHWVTLPKALLPSFFPLLLPPKIPSVFAHRKTRFAPGRPRKNAADNKKRFSAAFLITFFGFSHSSYWRRLTINRQALGPHAPPRPPLPFPEIMRSSPRLPLSNIVCVAVSLKLCT